ncbi:valine--tRNA ligase [Methanobrevibacter curvatus]|uniref:Valine--tRNA ligase n=1 Tax=Methanobrevibacter curvatus TaxID=49547 RepID=A0A166ABA6_9EURY|nr:valine--tRNA ligase [Methanobrevibacter curvatus]KZX11816.1 valine--tRNA ligase [Methanobrevibacter curvatus]
MTKKEIPKEYDHKKEVIWQKKWQDKNTHKFIGDGTRPRYVIDTPPPYPTGSIHMGHVLNWSYIDMVARYKRLRGYDVLFPQGWDCHGLPTEVKVEETHNIKKNDVSRLEFRDMCVDLTKTNIKLMKNQMKTMGFSQDWSMEYITMTPEYMKRTQYSFLKMYEEGLIYQGIHPVNWCPRCETAIAFAEVEYNSNKTYLNYVKFRALAETDDGYGVVKTDKDDKNSSNMEGGVLIATTRPELMSACVGVVVNPKDERYSDILGKKVEVPLSGQAVEVIADEEVDPNFGTGAVMVCTFGDKTDVTWVNKHNLDIIEPIDPQGKMTKSAGRYEGMDLKECKLQTIDDLKSEGCLIKQEEVDQNVGQCWRCKTPIEILVKKQWFVAVNKLVDDIKEASSDIKWNPKHMESRLLNWVDSMEWDWCISRQRIFATPIPVWYCKECGKVHVAQLHEIPIDPTQKSPTIIDSKKQEKPYICECGSSNFRGEEDVLDTWMDSSISPLSIAGWPKEDYSEKFPADLRPQGHDIIRTWAFYTILRTKALTGLKPFEEIEINGMVFGEDGYKMSKSRGNVIAPDDVIIKYGADALRIWASNSVPGSDVPFDWNDIKYGYKFLRKFWNAFRFISIHIFNDKNDSEKKTDDEINRTVFNDFNLKNSGNLTEILNNHLQPLDKWIISKLNNIVNLASESFESYNFATVINSTQSFVWHDFCDDYIEAVKYRLYSKETDEKAINSKYAAKYTLKTIIETVLKLLNPITPHFADEVYSYFSNETLYWALDKTLDNKIESIENTDWPKVNNDLIDLKAEEEGFKAVNLIAEIRRFKSNSKLPLNTPLSEVNIYFKNEQLFKSLEKFKDDIKGTLKINNLNFKTGKLEIIEKVVEITPAMDKIGPEFKGEAGKILKYLNSISIEKIDNILSNNGKIDIEGNIITNEHLNMKKEVVGSSGKKVEILNPENSDLLIEIYR